MDCSSRLGFYRKNSSQHLHIYSLQVQKHRKTKPSETDRDVLLLCQNTFCNEYYNIVQKSAFLYIFFVFSHFSNILHLLPVFLTKQSTIISALMITVAAGTARYILL